jgi:hypothetical protein
MIKLDQALTAAFIDGAFGLEIVHENDTENPPKGAKFCELQTFQNPKAPITLNGSSDVTGVLQFTLAWPLGGGAVPAKEQAQTVLDFFPAGKRVSFGGQTLVIGSQHLFRAAPNVEKGRYEVVGRINYAAIVPR